MATGKTLLLADGQPFEVDDEIAKDEALLRRAIEGVLPAFTGCDLKRETNKETGQDVVRLVKRAATKGLIAVQPETREVGPSLWLVPPSTEDGVFAALLAAPAEMHEALILTYELMARQRTGDEFSTEELLRLSPTIDDIERQVREARTAMEGLLSRLKALPATPTQRAPEGF